MHTRVLVSAIVVFCIGVSYASAASAPTSCLEEDRGYKLINTDGTIEPVRLYGAAVKKFSASSLNGKTSTQLNQFGVTTGDPREWARLFVMLCKQESSCRIARTYPDGSLEKFSSTPQGERSYGPLQFNIGEYGLSSWAMVNSPSCALEAFIRVAEQNKLFNYFGSMQRRNEVLQHANWFNSTVQPFADALTLTFDPNAPDRSSTYRALTPYFSDPYASTQGYRGPFGMLTSSLQPTQGAYASQGAYAGYGAGGQSPVSLALSGSQTSSILGTSGGSDSTGTTRGTLSTGTIIVQPQNAHRGSPLLISWTSVNMQPSSCVVTKNGAEFARGNEATKRDVISESTTYALECVDAKGEKAVSSFSIAI